MNMATNGTGTNQGPEPTNSNDAPKRDPYAGTQRTALDGAMSGAENEGARGTRRMQERHDDYKKSLGQPTSNGSGGPLPRDGSGGPATPGPGRFTDAKK
jgi:hypothetical protein